MERGAINEDDFEVIHAELENQNFFTAPCPGQII